MEWDICGLVEEQMKLSGRLKNNKLKVIYITTFLSSILIAIIIYLLTENWKILSSNSIIIIILLFWSLILKKYLHKELYDFTNNTCNTIDQMIEGKYDLTKDYSEETLISKIQHRLNKLYRITQVNNEEANRQKNEIQSLVSDISHQVKTPMTNINMIISTLKNDDIVGEKQNDFLESLSKEVNKLQFLMDALIKTSRLETGIVEINKKESSIYETLAMALGSIFIKAEDKKIKVFVNCPESSKIPHDSKWTSEALFNILDNAVKYSPVGGDIYIDVQPLESYTKISIKDSGIGIPEKSYPKIFQRFYREPSVHEYEGIGIGLYLAREIITRQGGYIKVSSELGISSTFSIFLPNY